MLNIVHKNAYCQFNTERDFCQDLAKKSLNVAKSGLSLRLEGSEPSISGWLIKIDPVGRSHLEATIYPAKRIREPPTSMSGVGGCAKNRKPKTKALTGSK